MERVLSIRDEVVASVEPLDAVELDLPAAAGMRLAVDAVAPRASPPFSCSAMDGYAVRASEVSDGRPLRIVATVYAGDPMPPPIGAGEAARIFTGAPIPAGADAVVMQEVTRRDGELVAATGAVAPGENVRPEGEDLRRGAVALEAGSRLGARQLALLAAVGLERVRVVRRPRVAVLSTGEEIVRGRVADSNGPAVAGILRAAGAEVAARAVGDGLQPLTTALAEALRDADAVVTIGGASVGERDHLAAAVRAVGGATRVHGVPMKPGKPFLFAIARGRPVLGLPGSPSACLVALEVFARPVIQRMAGARVVGRRALRARLAEPVAGKPGRARFLWARLGAGGEARPLGRDAAQVRGPALADALVLVPERAGDLPAGTEVDAWLLDDDA